MRMFGSTQDFTNDVTTLTTNATVTSRLTVTASAGVHGSQISCLACFSEPPPSLLTNDSNEPSYRYRWTSRAFNVQQQHRFRDSYFWRQNCHQVWWSHGHSLFPRNAYHPGWRIRDHRRHSRSQCIMHSRFYTLNNNRYIGKRARGKSTGNYLSGICISLTLKQPDILGCGEVLLVSVMSIREILQMVILSSPAAR